MFWFVVAIIAAIVALIAVGVSIFSQYKGAPIITALVAALVAAGTFTLSTIYTQGEGEAKVLRSFTGQVVGVDPDAGMGFKAPWVSAINFDVRNNVVTFEKISFTDKDSAASAVDLSVTYSLDREGVDKIYSEYKSQDTFEAQQVQRDIAAVVRQVPAKYNTVQVLSNREQISQDILTALETRWAGWGVTGVQVALGDFHYSQPVMERFESLVVERTNAETAKAATETAREKAKQRLVEAQAEADANELLEKSLTEKVIQNRQIDMLREVGAHGNLIITDGSGSTLLNVDTNK